jgi:biopolymer transport protein ExbD/biopolymer transport protein TolR
MNVTPLVDVVLVLLIIFMVLVPMMEKSPAITLPDIFNPDKDPKSKTDPYTLSLTKTGEVWFEKERLEPGAVETRLERANQDEPTRRIVVRADKETPYKEVRGLFKVCQGIGFPGVSLRVNARNQAEE